MLMIYVDPRYSKNMQNTMAMYLELKVQKRGDAVPQLTNIMCIYSISSRVIILPPNLGIIFHQRALAYSVAVYPRLFCNS